MLGIATVTYITALVDAALPQNEETRVHVVVLLLLAKMTNLNLLYTAIERVAFNYCNEKVAGGVWAYNIVYIMSQA